MRFLVLILCAIHLTACGGASTDETVDDEGDVSIQLQNLSEFEVNLLGPGESVSSSNELLPFDADPSTGDDIRFIFIRRGTPAVTIRAFFEGDFIGDIACEVPGGGLTSADFLTVAFTGNSLVCQLV